MHCTLCISYELCVRCLVQREKANTLTLAVGVSFLFTHYTKQAEPPLRAWFLCVVHSKLEEEFPPNFCHSNLNSHLKYMWVNSLVGSHNWLDLHIISPSPPPPSVRTSHGRPSDIERTKPSPWAPSCKKPWLSQTSSWSLGGQRNLQLESEKRIRIIILTSKNREIKKLEALKLI